MGPEKDSSITRVGFGSMKMTQLVKRYMLLITITTECRYLMKMELFFAPLGAMGVGMVS